MNETEVVLHVAFIANDETAEVEEPAVGPFDLPAPLVPAKLASVLVGSNFVVAPFRDDRLDPAPGKAFPQGVAIVPAVADQTIRVLARAARVVPANWTGVLEWPGVRRSRQLYYRLRLTSRDGRRTEVRGRITLVE